MDEALTPAPLSDKVLEHHKIFQVPIIVIPGLNHNAVRMQLETLLMQPGIKTEMVTVGQSDSKMASCVQNVYSEKDRHPFFFVPLFRFTNISSLFL